MFESVHLVVSVVVALVGLALGLLALRAPLSAAVRLAIVGLVALLAAVAFLGGERILGHARPAYLEILTPGDDVRVVYAQAVRDKGIYLLLAAADVPVYYRLPWNEETVDQLRRALEEAQRSQSHLMFRFEPSLEEREPMFYALPQPALPPKEPPEQGLEYRDPEWHI